MGDWVTGWLSDWVTGWLSDWVTGWLSDWVTGWLGDWVTGWLGDWVSCLCQVDIQATVVIMTEVSSKTTQCGMLNRSTTNYRSPCETFVWLSRLNKNSQRIIYTWWNLITKFEWKFTPPFMRILTTCLVLMSTTCQRKPVRVRLPYRSFRASLVRSRSGPGSWRSRSPSSCSTSCLARRAPSGRSGSGWTLASTSRLSPRCQGHRRRYGSRLQRDRHSQKLSSPQNWAIF